MIVESISNYFVPIILLLYYILLYAGVWSRGEGGGILQIITWNTEGNEIS